MIYSKEWTFNTIISLFIVVLFSTANATPWPTATTDSVVINKNESITIAVLDNDIGTNLSITEFDDWSDKGGQSTVDSSRKKITYTPKLNFIGADSFWYDFVDDQGRTNSAAVNITINNSTQPPPSNDEWPTATPDTATVKKNKSITINVLSNDIGNSLTLTEIDEDTIHSGKASINSTKKTVTYTPALNFVGTDSFWYTFADNQGRTNAAEVLVTVTNVSTPPTTDEWPTAIADTATTSANQSVLIPVLNNDRGNGLTITGVDTWTNSGRAYINSAKTHITYIPYAGFTGTDSFWYDFKDSQGRSNAAEITVTVTSSNNSSRFSHVEMHYDLLKNQGIVWGEIGSEAPYHDSVS